MSFQCRWSHTESRADVPLTVTDTAAVSVSGSEFQTPANRLHCLQDLSQKITAKFSGIDDHHEACIFVRNLLYQRLLDKRNKICYVCLKVFGITDFGKKVNKEKKTQRFIFATLLAYLNF